MDAAPYFDDVAEGQLALAYNVLGSYAAERVARDSGGRVQILELTIAHRVASSYSTYVKLWLSELYVMTTHLDSWTATDIVRRSTLSFILACHRLLHQEATVWP